MFLTFKSFGTLFDVKIFNGGDYYEIESITSTEDLTDALDGYILDTLREQVAEWMKEKEDELKMEGTE